MSGRLGGLSEHQAQLLRQMRERVPSDRSHATDADLLRFLRARKFHLDAAHEMLEACHRWRAEHDVDDILNQPRPLDRELEGVVQFAYHGEDKELRPLYIERTGMIDVHALVAFPADEMDRRHIYHMEHLVRLTEESSARHGQPIEAISVIMDMKGIGFQHRECLSIMKRVARMDADNYPERMGRSYIINAPWIFHSLWRVARLFLDPDTLNKFVILDASQLDKLLDYIDADQLPEEYGGTVKGVLPPVPGTSGELVERSIGTRKKFTRQLVLDAELSSGLRRRIEWSFRVNRDVLFSVRWHDSNGCEETGEEGVVVEAQRRVSHVDGMVTGVYTTESSGAIVFDWENDSGWYYKTIHYQIISESRIELESSL